MINLIAFVSPQSLPLTFPISEALPTRILSIF